MCLFTQICVFVKTGDAVKSTGRLYFPPIFVRDKNVEMNILKKSSEFNANCYTSDSE